MIIREKYLSKIRPFYNVDLIKVIMGIRRSGKSVILNQMMDELKDNGVADEQIIYLNFEFEDYYNLCDHIEFNKYVEGKMVNDKKYYLFFDEIKRLINGN